MRKRSTRIVGIIAVLIGAFILLSYLSEEPRISFSPSCENNITELDEACDGPDLNNQTCVTQGYDNGTLACNFDCESFDTSACLPPEGTAVGVGSAPLVSTCGDSVINGTEQCDDNNTISDDGCSDLCKSETACASDLNCTDSLDCNGAETCSLNGFCLEGSDMCPSNQLCIESNDTCINHPPFININFPSNNTIFPNNTDDIEINFKYLAFNLSTNSSGNHINFYIDNDPIPREFYKNFFVYNGNSTIIMTFEFLGDTDNTPFGIRREIIAELIEMTPGVYFSPGQHNLRAVIFDSSLGELSNQEAQSSVAFTIDTSISASSICGNNITESGEDCDDGNNEDNDRCNSCELTYCGDDEIQSPNGENVTEECDDGDDDDHDGCVECKEAECGDGEKWTGQEECDDGNNDNNDNCTNSCKINTGTPSKKPSSSPKTATTTTTTPSSSDETEETTETETTDVENLGTSQERASGKWMWWAGGVAIVAIIITVIVSMLQNSHEVKAIKKDMDVKPKTQAAKESVKEEKLEKKGEPKKDEKKPDKIEEKKQEAKPDKEEKAKESPKQNKPKDDDDSLESMLGKNQKKP